MIKLDISVAEEMSSFPQVNFSTPLETSHSEADENVLADLEHLWGENRDCFETLLNSTGTTTASDCDSCDDYSDSSVTRFSTKPLVSKLAPIGETFGRNHLNVDSTVSNTLNMVSAGQYFNSGEEEILNSSTPIPKRDPEASDILIPETPTSQKGNGLNDKQLGYFGNFSENFEKPETKPVVRPKTKSPSVSDSESSFQPLNYSLKNPYTTLELPLNNKQQSAVQPFAATEMEQKESEFKMSHCNRSRSQMTFGGLVTPPVSPEEEQCSVETNRLPISTCFSRPPPHYLASSHSSFYTGNPSAVQSHPYPHNNSASPYPYSVPIHHHTYYTYHTNQNLLASKIKIEPNFTIPDAVPTTQRDQIHLSQEISGYQPNFHQVPISSHFPSHHNWVNQEKAVINNTNSVINGQTPEAYALQKVRVKWVNRNWYRYQ